jgi:hypothetical protein
MVAVGLNIFSACQKEEQVLIDEQPQEAVRNLMFVGLDTIAFSVEDNRLVFESEEEFQKGIDFLAQLGDENFAAFEKEIGFDSYRKVLKGTSNWAEQIEDELLATLINPEGIVQVENYLFRIDFDKEKTYAYVLDDSETELKSAVVTEQKSPVELKWEDDAFAVLKGEPQLKGSGCRRNKTGYFYVNTTFGEVQYKIVYQKVAIYFSLQAKIKQSGQSYGYISLQTSKCWWKSKKSRWSGDASISIGGNGREYNFRPYSKRRGLKDYYYGVDFYISDEENVYTPSAYIKCN